MVYVQCWLVCGLVEGDLGWDVGGIGVEEVVDCCIVVYDDILVCDCFGQCVVVYGGYVGMQQFVVGEFVEDVVYVVGVMYVFYVVFWCVWCDFVQLWYVL